MCGIFGHYCTAGAYHAPLSAWRSVSVTCGTPSKSWYYHTNAHRTNWSRNSVGLPSRSVHRSYKHRCIF